MAATTGQPPPVLTGPFGLLPEQDRATLLSLGTRRTYAHDEVLIRQGDPPRAVQVILSGRVRVVRHTSEGRDLLMALGRPGDVMGELAALDGARRTSTVTALGDVGALTIPAQRFRAFLLERPRAALSILQALAGRLRESNARAVETATQSAQVRLARRLLELAASDGRADRDGAVEIGARLTQEELASWVGLSREAVAGVLQDLRDDEIVTTGRRSIRVCDLEALRRRAGL